MKKSFITHNGFSLVEILIAVGLLGIISVGVMTLSKNMSTTFTQSEVRLSEIEVKQAMVTTLADRAACKKTFEGKNIGELVSAVKVAGGNAIFKTDEVYANRSIKILEMKTVDTGMTGSDGLRTVNFVVTFQKNRKNLEYQTKGLTIPLRVKAASAISPIVDCYSDSEEIVNTAKEEVCLALAGNWDSATMTCSLGQYVKKSGDTMSGDLNLPSLHATANISSMGSVGIGTSSPSSKLDVRGTINSSADVRAISFQYTSDRSLKKDIAPIEQSLEKLLKLKPVTFKWKQNNKADYGFIAQEVQQVIPEITSVDESHLMHVDYAKLVPLLIDVVQHQQKEIEALKKKLKQ